MLGFPSIRSLPALRCLLLLALAFLVPHAHAARTILIFGDSLSAGYGIRQEAAWPSLLATRLNERQLDYNVVNASISGETTSGGRARIDAALAKHSPAIVIIALGSNDGLRGLPLRTMRDNLNGISAAALKTKAKVLIVGQRLPPNYGSYAQEFHQAFGDIAQSKKTAYVDFLLDGLATRPEFFQADNLHPTAEAQPRLLDNVWRGLEPLLK
jgi:acyl-CoA thioesterase-1